MLRRRLAVTFLVIIAVQLLGAVAFASVCAEPCPDDTEETSCPPVCALCTSCTHAQQAIVQPANAGAPITSVHHLLSQQRLETSSQLPADIFHVPLLG
jgi:hypothetical protein